MFDVSCLGVSTWVVIGASVVFLFLLPVSGLGVALLSTLGEDFTLMFDVSCSGVSTWVVLVDLLGVLVSTFGVAVAFTEVLDSTFLGVLVAVLLTVFFLSLRLSSSFFFLVTGEFSFFLSNIWSITTAILSSSSMLSSSKL